MRAGDCSLPWEPELVSPCFTFYSIGQGRVVFLVFVCCFGVLFALFFLVPDLSFWSRCLTMTILAQPNDCHSCNDARSIVQKKKVWQKSLIGASRVQAWHQEESDSLLACQFRKVPNKLHTTEAHTRWNTSYYDNWRRVWEAPPVHPVHILYLISSKPRPRTTESFGHSPHCSHWRQSRTPDSLPLVPVTTKHKSLHGAYNRHLPMVGQPTVPSQAAENRTWWFLSSLSGSTPWPQWNGVSFFQDPLWALWL